MKELWLPIDGCDFFEVSNLGRVKSLPRPKTPKENILKGGLCSKKKYRHVNIKTNNSKVRFASVHRLVASAFLPNPNGYKFVNHKNSNSQDNTIDNLEWCTSRENNSHMRMKMKGSSKYVGVHFNKDRNKYYSTIKVNGKVYFLGRFKKEEDAAEAYIKALNKFGIQNRYASNNSI